MAKKTLSTLLQCPTDFLYLWASDEFISQLGSKAQIIREKKYYQHQSLWRTMVDNTQSKNADELQKTYQSWAKQIAEAIKGIYGMTPAEILVKLAMGEPVLGKNWNEGVYGGIGKTKLSFSQTTNVTVDGETGEILCDGEVVPGQTAIYGADGSVSGYSCLIGGEQFQSAMGSEGYYGAYSYSKGNGLVQDSNGNVFDSSASSFWQNTENYMPIVNELLAWLKSLISSLLPGDRTVLTTENTVPKQTEWVEEDGNGGLLAGGIALAALALITMEQPKKKNK